MRAPAFWAVKTVAVPSIKDADRLVDPANRHLRRLVVPHPAVGRERRPQAPTRRGLETLTPQHGDFGDRLIDSPTHHYMGDLADMAIRMMVVDFDVVVFGHDMLNAYRQWPVRDPGHCGTCLPTEGGHTLWFHNAMCFGAAASVWHFNRAADAIQMLLHAMLLVVGGHYVDNFSAVELTPPSRRSRTSSPSWDCRSRSPRRTTSQGTRRSRCQGRRHRQRRPSAHGASSGPVHGGHRGARSQHPVARRGKPSGWQTPSSPTKTGWAEPTLSTILRAALKSLVSILAHLQPRELVGRQPSIFHHRRLRGRLLP